MVFWPQCQTPSKYIDIVMYDNFQKYFLLKYFKIIFLYKYIKTIKKILKKH